MLLNSLSPKNLTFFSYSLQSKLGKYTCIVHNVPWAINFYFFKMKFFIGYVLWKEKFLIVQWTSWKKWLVEPTTLVCKMCHSYFISWHNYFFCWCYYLNCYDKNKNRKINQKVVVPTNKVLSKSESVKFSLIEWVICLFTDLSVKNIIHCQIS